MESLTPSLIMSAREISIPYGFQRQTDRTMKIIADENIPLLMEYFGAMGEVIPRRGRYINAKDVVDADALLVRSVTNVDERLIQDSGLSFVGTCTAGFDHVDDVFLASRNIRFTNAPGCNATSVVEYVMAALDVLAERDGFDLQQRVVGIVGKGQVGGRLYKRLEALGVQVYATDPLCQPEASVRFLELDELIETCDVICLHTPLVREGDHPTWHMIDEHRLAAMKPGTILVSAGRGPVVDNQALKRVLMDKQALSVVMDVWEFEPDADPELIALVDIATPHIAGYSLDGKIRGTEMIYQAFCQHFGIPVQYSEGELTPPPALQAMTFSPSAQLYQACSTAIRSVYDIRRDDTDMRQLIHLNEIERKKAFDGLRKSYSERREFSTLALSFNNTAADVQKALVNLGFNRLI